MSDMTQEQVAALWTRINEINCELVALSADAGTNILRSDAAERNAAFEHRSAVLRQELVEVHAKLPPAGMASGMRLVMSRALGEIILREIEPEPPPDDSYDRSDPYERYEHEVGIFRDE